MQDLLSQVYHGHKAGIVSVISELEVLVRPLREGTWLDIERARVLLDAPNLQVIDLDRRTTRMAAEIRAQTGLNLADAAIVATAVATGCDVVVGNDARCAERVREVPYLLLDELAGRR